MINDPSRVLSGTYVSRMSKYLSLCKIECFVRKASQLAPSRRVDQPSKVGQAGTEIRPIQKANPVYTLRVDYTRKSGNRSFTLKLKKELTEKSGLTIESLTEVGTVIIQRNNQDWEQLSLYSVVSYVGNFAKQRKEWKFCLVFSKQANWVSGFLALARTARLQADYLLDIGHGQIRYFNVPKS